MALTLFNKSVVPTNADAWNLVGDLKTFGESLNVVIPVNSQAERDALPAEAGMAVTRLDRRYCPIEIYDGSAWQTGSTGWTNIPLVAGYSSQGALFTPRYSRVGETVFIEGAVKKTTGSLPGGLAQISASALPTWARPGSEIYGVTAIDQVANISRIRVTMSGDIYVGGADGANYAFLTLTYRAADMGSL